MISKKIFQKIISVFIALSFIISTILSYPPVIAQAETATSITAKQDSSKTMALTNKATQNSAQSQKEQSSTNNTQTTFSQEEIDKIVNDHLATSQKTSQDKVEQDKVDQGKTNQDAQTRIDELLPQNQKTDRFIIKYKNEDQKQDTVNKIKGSIKERTLTRNKKFDVYVTSEKMKKEDFAAVLKQKNADSNIEYIQPDYQVTVASVDSQPQSQPQADTQIPELSGTSFDGLKINLAYNETLNSSSIPSSNDFAVKTKDGQSVDIRSIEITGNSLVITLSAPQAAGDPVIVSYVQGTSLIQDSAGNPADGFTGKQVEYSTTSDLSADKTVPTLVSVQGNESTLTLQYSEALDTTSIPDIKDFTIICQDENGNPVLNAITNITIQDQAVRLTLENNLTAGQTIQLSYIPGENPIKDLAGNTIEGFNNKAIAFDTTAPVLKTATINTSTLEISFDKPLKADSLPSTEDFSISLNGIVIPQAIKSLTITGNKVVLTLTQPVATDDVILLSYTPGNIPLMDTAGNIVSQITGLQVNNLTSTINDPRFSEQWGLFANIINTITNIADSVGINVVDAWIVSEGDGVVVAVLDTGIDITHEDLQGNIWANSAEIAGNGIDDDGNGYIDDINGWNFPDNTNSVHSQATASDEWHGTHVAGIIAAQKNNQLGIAGVAPQAKIMPLQVFKNGTAYTSDILSAIHYAEQNGAQVVNCSWGTTSENTALKEAMEVSGLLFVCAAGNSNSDIDANPVYPASLTGNNIISVNSVNENGNLSCFSNYGANSVDVAAPGEDILSTAPGNTYKKSGGTSQAAAFVTGEAALILSKYPNASLDEVRSRIITSCEKLSSLTGKVFSGGIINCDSALEDPVAVNNSILQITEEQTTEPGGVTPGNGDYDLYSVDEWNTRSSLMTARDSFGTVTIDNKIYCIGGRTNSTTLSSVEVYDPIQGSSTMAASMSTARYGLATAMSGGKIYAIGGYDGSSYLGLVEAYDPLTNTWTRLADMPTVRSGCAAAVFNGVIYVTGGHNSVELNKVEAYDPVSNAWSTKASMPTSVYNVQCAISNSLIYLLPASGLATVYAYDPVSDTWTTKSSMPKKYNFACTNLNGKVYIIGGYSSKSGDFGSNYEYSPYYDVWSERTGLSTTERFGLGAATVNGKIYALGGLNESLSLNTVEEYGSPTSNGKILKSMSQSRYGLGAASINGKVYAIGGNTYNGLSVYGIPLSSYVKNTVEMYDIATDTWTAKAGMPTARYGLGVIASNGKIYAVGGYNGTSYLNTVEEYDPSLDTWITKANMPSARAYLGLTVVNNKLYAIGGYNGVSYLNTVEEYNPSTNEWVTRANMPTPRMSFGTVVVKLVVADS